jgi:hypothetical protein
VQRNDNSHGGIVNIDNTWAFGQVLAFVMIIASLNEVVHFLLGYATRKRAHSRGHQVEAEETPEQAEGHSAAVSYRSRGGPGNHLTGKSAAAPPTRERVLSGETLVPGVPGDRTSSAVELMAPGERNVGVSERTAGLSSQTPDQPIGSLR